MSKLPDNEKARFLLLAIHTAGYQPAFRAAGLHESEQPTALVERILAAALSQARAEEREACANMVWDWEGNRADLVEAIRARGAAPAQREG